MPEPPAPPPAPDLDAIAARAKQLDDGPWGSWNECRGVPLNDLAQLVHSDVPALVAYARALKAENARLRAGLVEIRGLSMHSDWCWSESLRVDIDRLLRGEPLPGQEL